MNRHTLTRRLVPLALGALLFSPLASAWVSTVSLPGSALAMSGSVYGPAPVATKPAPAPTSRPDVSADKRAAPQAVARPHHALPRSASAGMRSAR